MEIRSVVTESIVSTYNNINIKCHEIIADNAFTLYRSSLPNLYDIREYGEYTIAGGHIQSWYAYFGFDAGSDEFNQLIDGQEFRFTDFAFGLKYKFTKKGNKWIGDMKIHIMDI